MKYILLTVMLCTASVQPSFASQVAKENSRVKEETKSVVYQLGAVLVPIALVAGLMQHFFGYHHDDSPEDKPKGDRSLGGLGGFQAFGGMEGTLLGRRDLPTKRELVVQAAQGFVGKLDWLIEAYPCWYTSDEGTSDFKILYWQNGCHIPQAVLQEAQRKRQQLSQYKAQKIPTNSRLKMCCWEFCILCLIDAEVVNECEIDRICTIVHHINRGTIVKALLKKENSLKLMTKENLPRPGDIIFFFDSDPTKALRKPNSRSIPDHAAIWIGHMQFVDLDEGCQIKTHSLSDVAPGRAYFVSLEDALDSIKIFIELFAEDTLACPILPNANPLEILPPKIDLL